MDESRVAAVPELQTPEVSVADSPGSTSFFVALQHVISTLNRIRGAETRESLRVLHGPLTASAGGGVQVDFMLVVGARPVQHTLVVRRVVDGEQATFACAVTPKAAGLEQGLVAACRDARSLFDAVEFCLAHLHTEQQRVSVPGLDRWDAKEFAARLSEHDLALSLLRAALVGNRTATVLRPMPAVGPAFKLSAADRRKGRDLDADLKLLVSAPFTDPLCAHRRKLCQETAFAGLPALQSAFGGSGTDSLQHVAPTTLAAHLASDRFGADPSAPLPVLCEESLRLLRWCARSPVTFQRIPVAKNLVRPASSAKAP